MLHLLLESIASQILPIAQSTCDVFVSSPLQSRVHHHDISFHACDIMSER